MNYREKILELKKKKNAVIMTHYYNDDDLQDIADMVGDSLALAKYAATTAADIIVVCGVHFMGETAKILCPGKKVLVPDVSAGCSLADSCKETDFKAFLRLYPGYKVISYVNTSTEIKALTDVVVTSSNAKQIVDSFDKDAKLIFGPDKNLGAYINKITGRNMVLWNGACHVHEKYSLAKLSEIKKQHPLAKVLVHPECKGEISDVADYVGSTAGILKYPATSPANEFIIVTESGILHELKKSYPDKTFIPLPVEEAPCNKCEYMRLNTMEKLYNCLLNETPEITIEENIRKRGYAPIEKMLELSGK